MVKKMRNLLSGALLLILVACASNPGVQWAQQQQLANTAMEIVIRYRTPCIDTVTYPGAGPDHPLCRVDDATWDWAYGLSEQIDVLLQGADLANIEGNGPAALRYLDLVESLLFELQWLQLKLEGPAS